MRFKALVETYRLGLNDVFYCSYTSRPPYPHLISFTKHAILIFFFFKSLSLLLINILSNRRLRVKLLIKSFPFRINNESGENKVEIVLGTSGSSC